MVKEKFRMFFKKSQNIMKMIVCITEASIPVNTTLKNRKILVEKFRNLAQTFEQNFNETLLVDHFLVRSQTVHIASISHLITLIHTDRER